MSVVMKKCKDHLTRAEKCVLSFDNDSVDVLINLIKNTKGFVIFTGVGKNGHIAALASSTFASMGIKSIYINPVDAVHGDMGNITEKDLVINISKSGNTLELLGFLKNLKLNKKTKIVSIHSNASAQTVKFSDLDIFLSNPTEVDKFDIVPTTSIVSYLIFLQSLGVTIADEMQFSLKKFKLNHPGGSIGEKLKDE